MDESIIRKYFDTGSRRISKCKFCKKKIGFGTLGGAKMLPLDIEYGFRKDVLGHDVGVWFVKGIHRCKSNK